MAYNSPSDINASAGLPSFFDYLNSVTFSWFSNMILISLYIIIAIAYSRATNDWIGGFAAAGFGTFAIGMLFFLGGLISGVTFSYVVAFMLIGALVLFVTRK